jgi:hypothetical protein
MYPKSSITAISALTLCVILITSGCNEPLRATVVDQIAGSKGQMQSPIEKAAFVTTDQQSIDAQVSPIIVYPIYSERPTTALLPIVTGEHIILTKTVQAGTPFIVGIQFESNCSLIAPMKLTQIDLTIVITPETYKQTKGACYAISIPSIEQRKVTFASTGVATIHAIYLSPRNGEVITVTKMVDVLP